MGQDDPSKRSRWLSVYGWFRLTGVINDPRDGADAILRRFYDVEVCILAEAQANAPDDLAAHIARSKRLHQEGKVLMAGAFLDRPEEPVSTMVVCSSRESAEEFAKDDPFVIKGMVSHWTV